MGKVHAVLLVPNEGDPLGLLREGPCGARPPIAVELVCDRCESMWTVERGGVTLYRVHQHHGRWGRGCAWNRRALVLAWDGEHVGEGMDWVLRRLPGGWRLATGLESLSAAGTLIRLDAEGREVADG